MKHLSYLGLMFLIMLSVGACSKQSAVEGKLLDWDGNPVAGVTVKALQLQPIKGYEELQTVTNLDGEFKIKGLYPSSKYVIKPWSDKWTCEVSQELVSAPQGETAVLPQTLQIDKAYSRISGGLIMDLDTGTTRFSVSADGVITDAITGLQWLTGSDLDTDYSQAKRWINELDVGGGNWRMPTREELSTIYFAGVGERNMDPAFDFTGWYVWAEPFDSKFAYICNFVEGGCDYHDQSVSVRHRAFAVRSVSQ